MALFELEEGRLVPAQFGREVPDGFSDQVLHAVRMQVLEIVSRPLFPIAWQPGSGGDQDAPRLTALDAAGQVVAVEVVRDLDADVLIDALSRLADSAAMSWTDLARQYPHGIEGFKRGWAKFRESMPTSPPNGPRMVLVAAHIAPEVRPALDVLSSSGVEVHEMSLRQTSNGRAFLEVDPVGQRLYNHRFTPILESGNAVGSLAAASRKTRRAQVAGQAGSGQDVLARRRTAERRVGTRAAKRPAASVSVADAAALLAGTAQQAANPVGEPSSVSQPIPAASSRRQAKAPGRSARGAGRATAAASAPAQAPSLAQSRAGREAVSAVAAARGSQSIRPVSGGSADAGPVADRRPSLADTPGSRSAYPGGTRSDRPDPSGVSWVPVSRASGASGGASAPKRRSSAEAGKGTFPSRSTRHSTAEPAAEFPSRRDRRGGRDSEANAPVGLDAAGLAALARTLGDDVPLSLRPASRGPRGATLSLEGQIIVPAGSFTDPTQALRASGIYDRDGWSAWCIGDDRGPTLRESIEEVNRNR